MARKGNRIVPGVAKRVAAHQAAGRQPSAPEQAMAAYRLGGVVRAGGKEPARSPEIRRNTDFIGAQRHQGDADGSGVQGCGDSRLQGRSGWY